MENTENGVEGTTDSTDEDLDFCDQKSLASSLESSTEEMFLDGLDPFLDRWDSTRY